MNYLASRLQRAIRSPHKLLEYLTILVRIPYLYTYYQWYNWNNEESVRWKTERQATQTLYLENNQPLVSIIIPTYNRADILLERPLRSLLDQTYQNFEVLIVGDGCTDHTAEVVASLNDPRFRYTNLPERGKYPQDPLARWMVAGTPPMNYGGIHATGLWIGHVDDDELFTRDHIEKLLKFALEGKYEFVYSKVNQELAPGQWEEVGKTPIIKYLHMSHCGHSTTLWRRYLNHFNYDLNSWRLKVPVDKGRWSRMQLAGVRIGFLPEITVIAPLRPGVTLFGHQSEDRE